jgi:hypothetical protein
MPTQATIIGGSASGVSANAGSLTVPNTGGGITAGKRRWLAIDVANTTISNEGSLTGWTLVTPSGGVALASTRRGYIYTCIANGAESTTFNFAAANNHAAVWWQTDAEDPQDPVEVDPPTPTGSTSTQTTASSPDLTTTLDKALLIVIYFAFSTSTSATFTTPSGMSIIGGQTGNGSAGHSVKAFSEARATAGAVGARSSTIGTASAWASMSFAIGPGLDPGQFLPFFM